MGIMFNAVNANYKMPMQYKYTWNTLQNFGQFRDKRIWKNFEYFIDWMEENFTKEYFFEVMGKSYDLEDSILYRIEGMEQKNNRTNADNEKKETTTDSKKSTKMESWLMLNILQLLSNLSLSS